MHCTDVREVKEAVLRTAGASRVGSTPTPCSILIPCSYVRDERLHSMSLWAEDEPLEGIGRLDAPCNRKGHSRLHVFLRIGGGRNKVHLKVSRENNV